MSLFKAWSACPALMLSCPSVVLGLPATLGSATLWWRPPLGSRGSSRHGGNSDFRMDFEVLKEWPVGPHKALPPFVKHDGRQGVWKNYKNVIHYPKDGQYTIKKLPVTKLAGRDPVTGRKVVQPFRGGQKQKARWVDWMRLPADWDRGDDGQEGPDLVEKVVRVCYDPMRKSKLALTGYGERLRWQIATQNMKEGDLIKTSWKIPKIPVKPNEGDSHPLGALPIGTDICMVQWYPDSDVVKITDEEDFAKVMRKVGERVVIQREKTKLQYSLDQRCQCVVGKVSIHPLKAIDIGSPNRARWMGMAPSSGLWHRKTGRFGRKIRALPPIEEVNPPGPPEFQELMLHCGDEGFRGAPQGKKRPFQIDLW